MTTQSSSAQNRSLGDWYNMIKLGQIKLPRFQRMEAWDRNRIKSFIDTMIKNLPVGVSLIYERGDTEKFISRYISTSEPENPERLTEYLLDGQQRLTSFWRVMHNNYELEKYFLYFPEYDNSDDGIEFSERTVYCRTRWVKNDRKYPIWADIPKECLKKGLIPLELFNPEFGVIKAEEWIEDATINTKPTDRSDPEIFEKLELYNENKSNLKTKTTQIRESLKYFNLPYLALPVSTHKEIALQVFINMNTNSKPLSLYDIIVAEVEGIRGESLHDLQNSLNEQNPDIKNYFDLSNLILSTSALLQNKLPNNRGMIEMDKFIMIEQWELLCRCLNRMAGFLQLNKIYDRPRLPTNAVLSVIAAIYSMIPDTGDLRGKYEILLKKYLWSSFFTDRYENSAASRAFNDYQAILKVINNEIKDDGNVYTESDIPVLDREKYPISTVEELLTIGWPKQENIRGRAILAVASYLGAIDFADGQPMNKENVLKREYHHLYPDALLKEAKIGSYKALNCALITWKTNRIIGRDDPLTYIKKRSEWTNKDILKERLDSHLIPIPELSTGEYSEISGDIRIEKIKNDFDKFMNKRAALIVAAAKELTEGKEIVATNILAMG
jgi:hypothetical protein